MNNTVPYPSQTMRELYGFQEDNTLISDRFMGFNGLMTVEEFERVWEWEFSKHGGDLSRLMDDLTFSSPGSKTAESRPGKGYQTLLMSRSSLERDVALIQQGLDGRPGQRSEINQATLVDTGSSGRASFEDTIRWLDDVFPSRRKAMAVLAAASAWNMEKKGLLTEDHESVTIGPFINAVYEYARRITGRESLPWARIASATLGGDYQHLIRKDELKRHNGRGFAEAAIKSMARQAVEFCRDFVVVRARMADEASPRTFLLIDEYHARAKREADQQAADADLRQAMLAHQRSVLVERKTKENPDFQDMYALDKETLVEMRKTMRMDDFVGIFIESKPDIDSLFVGHGIPKPSRSASRIATKELSLSLMAKRRGP